MVVSAKKENFFEMTSHKNLKEVGECESFICLVEINFVHRKDPKQVCR